MNCCKPEQVGTREDGKLQKRIQVLEKGRIPANEVRYWKVQGPKKRITTKGNGILWNELETRGFMAQQGLWKVAREKKFWKTEVPCQEKQEIKWGNTKLCTKKLSQQAGHVTM